MLYGKDFAKVYDAKWTSWEKTMMAILKKSPGYGRGDSFISVAERSLNAKTLMQGNDCCNFRYVWEGQ